MVWWGLFVVGGDLCEGDREPEEAASSGVFLGVAWLRAWRPLNCELYEA